MQGTEKQIRWAEEILANTTGSIDRMIELCKSNKAYAAQLDAWQYMQNRYAVMMQHPKFQDASFVISNRDNKVFHVFDIITEAETVAHNRQLPLMETLKNIIG